MWNDTVTPATPAANDGHVDRRRRASSAATSTARSPAPVLQGRGEHRHAHRPPVDQADGTLLATRRSRARPRRAGSRSTLATPVADHRRTRRTSCRYFSPSGYYAVQRRLLRRLGRRQSAAARASADRRRRPNGVYHYGADAFPTIDVQREQLLGRRRVLEPAPTRRRRSSRRGTPAPSATDVAARLQPSRRPFNEALDPAHGHERRPSQLRDGSNALVPAAVTYDAGDAHRDPRRRRAAHAVHRRTR